MRKCRGIVETTAAISLFLLWEFSPLPPYVLPPPSAILREIVRQWNLLMDHSFFTLLEAFAGLLLGLFMGVGLAVAMDLSEVLRRMLYPFLEISKATPLNAITPHIVIWFGLGIGTKIGTVAFVSLFPIAMNTLEGMRTVDPDALDLFKVLKARKRQVYTYLVVPHTLPYVLSGLKVSATYSVVSAVIAEWLGAEKGLGVYMIRAMNTFRTDRLFASVVLVLIFSLGIFKLVDLVSKKLTPWFEERRLKV